MQSFPAVYKPVAAVEEKKIAGPCEISALALKTGGGAATVSLYDGIAAQDKIPANLKWVLDASTTVPDNQSFDSPLIFKKGIYAVFEQGGDTNPALCYAANAYAV